MLKVAQGLPSGTWWREVQQLIRTRPTAQPIPCLHEANICPVMMFELARADSRIRQNILKEYRLKVIRPALSVQDDLEFLKAATKFLPGLEVKYIDLCPTRAHQGWDSLLPLLGQSGWHNVKLWTYVRLTGLWPVCMFTDCRAVVKLEACPLCDEQNVPVKHALHSCPGTVALFRSSRLAANLSRNIGEDCFLHMLFHSTTSASVDVTRVSYVGEVMKLVVLSYLQALS